MLKKYEDLTEEELITEYNYVEKQKSERIYFAFGAMAGVLGNLAINKLFEIL